MLSQRVRLHNRFDFEIYDIETGKTEYAKAENIVLNQMYNRLCAMGNYFNNIGVGTGAGTLSPTRTSLFTYLAYKSASTVETVYDTEKTAHITKQAVFSETEAIGQWSEVGIMYAASSASFVTHAFITDSEGNPITINKTNTKIITVYATVYAEIIETETENIGIPKIGILRALLSNPITTPYFMLSSLRRTSGSLSRLGAFALSSVSSFSSDVANKRSYTPVKRFAATEGNGDIRSIALCYCSNSSMDTAFFFGGVNVPHSPLFNSYAYSNIAIGTGDGVTKEFDFPKAHIKPESETIKVNGVTMTRGVDYTVLYGMKSTDTLLIDIANNNTPVGDFDEIIELPQPPGSHFTDGAATITSIEFKNGSENNSNKNFRNYDIKLSVDGISWVEAGSGGPMNYGQVVTLNSFPHDKYKYMRVKMDRLGGTGVYQMPYEPATGYYAGKLSYFKVYATPPTAQKQIKFINAPANGAVITADFSVDYIPKSSNFVLDVQSEILFGEGV